MTDGISIGGRGKPPWLRLCNYTNLASYLQKMDVANALEATSSKFGHFWHIFTANEVLTSFVLA